MKTSIQLLNNVIGQLEGIKQMIDKDEDCFKSLTQMKAARSALSSLMDKYMEDYFTKCLKECRKDDREELCKKFFKEIIKK